VPGVLVGSRGTTNCDYLLVRIIKNTDANLNIQQSDKSVVQNNNTIVELAFIEQSIQLLLNIR